MKNAPTGQNYKSCLEIKEYVFHCFFSSLIPFSQAYSCCKLSKHAQTSHAFRQICRLPNKKHLFRWQRRIVEIDDYLTFIKFKSFLSFCQLFCTLTNVLPNDTTPDRTRQMGMTFVLSAIFKMLSNQFQSCKQKTATLERCVHASLNSEKQDDLFLDYGITSPDRH